MPFRKDGYWYYRRFETGQEYDRLYRRQGHDDRSRGAAARPPRARRGHDYFSLGAWDVTPDGRLLAWTEDTVSRRQYTIHVRDLATGERLRGEDRQLLRRRGLGERQPDPVLHREGPGHAPRLPRPPPPARQRPGERPGGLGGEGQRPSTPGSASRSRAASSRSPRRARSRPRSGCSTPTGRPSRSASSCRANAITSTPSRTWATGSSSAPTGRRRTSA